MALREPVRGGGKGLVVGFVVEALPCESVGIAAAGAIRLAKWRVRPTLHIGSCGIQPSRTNRAQPVGQLNHVSAASLTQYGPAG